MWQTPGARSRSPVACRWTSRTTRPCASAVKPSDQAAGRSRSRRVAPRTRRPGRAPGACCGCRGRARAGEAEGLHLSGDHDQPTSGGGSLLIAAVPGHSGRRPLSWVLGVRRSGHLGGAHDALHSAAIPAAHGGPWPRGSREERPALAGHGAEAVCGRHLAHDRHVARATGGRSLTWDQGAERAQHARLKIEAGVRVHFCDPQPAHGNARHQREHQRICCASTSPKGPISAWHSANETAAVAAAPNSRPRKTFAD